MTENESKAMPSAIGQPYPASEKEFVTPVPNTKTADTSMSEEIDKQSPCWDGYVQRGMKPGSNGKPVPNCVPVSKADSMDKEDIPEGYHKMPDGTLMANSEHEKNYMLSAKDYTKSTKLTEIFLY
tara:strand:+ start:1092 stop:1466 length:375 start_codon:yes stop_codon:yes gene_type:complete